MLQLTPKKISSLLNVMQEKTKKIGDTRGIKYNKKFAEEKLNSPWSTLIDNYLNLLVS